MSVKPKNSEATVAETTMLKTGRKLEEGFPSESAGGKAKKPRLADKVELSKEINPKQKKHNREGINVRRQKGNNAEW